MSLVGATVKMFFEPSSLTPDCALKFSNKENVKLYEYVMNHMHVNSYILGLKIKLQLVSKMQLIGKNHFMFLFTFNSKKFLLNSFKE